MEHLPYRDEYHGEYQVLSKQRHNQRRWRNDLYDQQEEHVETDENRDGERYLKLQNLLETLATRVRNIREIFNTLQFKIIVAKEKKK